MEQVWPTKQPDGRVYERHIYKGPMGEGFIDIYYSVSEGGEVTVDRIHNGPEDRGDSSGVRVDSDIEKKVLRVQEEKAT